MAVGEMVAVAADTSVFVAVGCAVWGTVVCAVGVAVGAGGLFESELPQPFSTKPPRIRITPSKQFEKSERNDGMGRALRRDEGRK